MRSGSTRAVVRRAGASTTSTSTTTRSSIQRVGQLATGVRSTTSTGTRGSPTRRSRTTSSTTTREPVDSHRRLGGFTAADWKVDYNNISGGSPSFAVDGSSYTQPHPSTCAPAFSGYHADTTALSQNYAQWGGTDVSLAAGDTCLANASTSLASLFTIDKSGTSRPQGAAWDIGAYERVGG